MNGRFLLDTNIVIALFAQDKSVNDQLMQASSVFIPSIVMGELYYGARNSNQWQENLGRLDEFATENVILNCNLETARYYGIIKHQLKVKGRPIPENDIWIAALAMQYGLSVVSRDDHFGAVDNLSSVSW